MPEVESVCMRVIEPGRLDTIVIVLASSAMHLKSFSGSSKAEKEESISVGETADNRGHRASQVASSMEHREGNGAIDSSLPDVTTNIRGSVVLRSGHILAAHVRKHTSAQKDRRDRPPEKSFVWLRFSK